MARPDFSRRSPERELMDSKDISFEEFHHCLKTLAYINIFTFAYRPTVNWIKRIRENKPLVVLDAGSGGGDMLRKLAKADPSLVLIGVDLNPWSKKSAEMATRRKADIQYETEDIFSFAAGKDIDVIISSLFTHHLSDDQVVQFLQCMDTTARRGWFINDLHRHPLPYYFIKYAAKLFCRNRIVRNDAPVSVARAFCREDWQKLLKRAGIPSGRVSIQWSFPFRYCVSCIKE
jgi:2-polyprenyl-3-methyl-5-hydroxy-6-metoxy-1,4-benzoquinol methylase